MGDLQRERDGRDLRISRGHVAAAAVGTLVLAATAFALGYTVGREYAPAAVVERPGLDADRPLVELLAKVEASSRPYGGVEALTFPEALGGADVGPAPLPEGALGADGVPVGPVDPSLPPDPALMAPLPVGEPVVVSPAGVTDPVGDAPPAGAFTLEVTRARDEGTAVATRQRLRAGGVEAWIALVRTDGAPSWRVQVAGYPDEAAARAQIAPVAERLAALGVVGAPVVVPMKH